MEIRRDISKRTSQDLFREYFQTRPKDEVQSNAYRQAVLELALGIINKDEKFLGYFDFAVWYYNLLEKEGYVEEKMRNILPGDECSGHISNKKQRKP